MKKIMCILLMLTIVISVIFSRPSLLYGNIPDITAVNTDNVSGLSLTSKAAILMEASTGKVIFEQNADEVLSPASITKIMTLILIFEAIDEGKLDYDDMVTTSEHAKSMGGSQVFLETGEQQTVETMIKCIIIASGNDASVAMAEHIAGSEEEFVRRMNEKAASLGMTNTVFKDCCGLYDTMDHHSTARDVALMSRELLVKHPEIKNYTKIWMENITHVTAKGSSEFTLSNTNRLIKQYEWATGLKTGSTSLAKYCLSATAMKDGVELIAVIMAAPDYKVRFSEAVTLLNYGYNAVSLYEDTLADMPETVDITGGTRDTVTLLKPESFRYICTGDEKAENITKQYNIPDKIKAPVAEGQTIGYADYFLNGNKIGSVELKACKKVSKASYIDYFKKICYKYIIIEI